VYFLDPDTRRYVESRIERRYRKPRERVMLAAAEAPEESYPGLSKEGAQVSEALAAVDELAGYAADAELVADVGAQLARDDYAEWRDDAERRQLLERSIARVLKGAGVPAGRVRTLSELLLDRL
jgi:hypothetical protein